MGLGMRLKSYHATFNRPFIPRARLSKMHSLDALPNVNQKIESWPYSYERLYVCKHCDLSKQQARVA